MNPPAGLPPETGDGLLSERLRQYAVAQPEARAYVLLSERGHQEAAISFAGLHARATGLAHRMAGQAGVGERALLLFPTGIDFVVAFFACLIARIIAVPMMLPRRQSTRDASASILADCAPRLALTTSEVLAGRRGDIVSRLQSPDLTWLAVDSAALGAAAAGAELARAGPDDIAFLQYTSGSTAVPKGVMVRHRNLIANLEMSRAAFGGSAHSTCVSWVPLFHDMGLVFNAMRATYVGALCVLLPPAAFLQRPWLWLRAIHEYRGEIAAAPNFAYDLCVDRYRPETAAGLDLSGWRFALNGAEPIRAATLQRFAETFAPHGFEPSALYPAYGLAEATVMAAAGNRGGGWSVRRLDRAALQQGDARSAEPGEGGRLAVGCGRALAGERIAIVSPEDCRRLAPDQVGEIWLSGPHIAKGYWGNSAATRAAFRARIAGEDDTPWLRTGDLGFLDQTGELFVTGRLKEVIIIRGVNHYPQDIENTVQNCHPALRRDGGAAFAVADENGPERLIVVQEVERTERHRIEPAKVIGAIREAIVTEHEIAPAQILLLRPGSLPKTTSGKIQRGVAAQMWRDGALTLLDGG
ncbi:MAG: fatty acyl-AMP ligase [Alphaproteobacteria bacterium]|nr:fatty acyl-AMP ligase [Alphaproteobacteria bacterium]